MTKAAYLFTSTDRRLAVGIDPRLPNVATELRLAGVLPLMRARPFTSTAITGRIGHAILLRCPESRTSLLGRKQLASFVLRFAQSANSTNERTGIFAILPPGVLFSNKAPCERSPGQRPLWLALTTVGCCNSLAFDFILRRKRRGASTCSCWMDAQSLPLPPLSHAASSLAHSALRLTCNHEGYLPLWQEQLGEHTWREPPPREKHLARSRRGRRPLGGTRGD